MSYNLESNKNAFISRAQQGVNKSSIYLTTIILVIISFVAIGQIPLLIGIMIFATINGISLEDVGKFAENPSLIGMPNNVFISLYILTFVISLVVLLICVKFLHKRDIKTLIISEKKFNFNKILFSGGVYLAILVLVELILYAGDPSNYYFEINYKALPGLVLLSLFLIPLQTSFEEIFFRGYLLQGIGSKTKNNVIAIFITGIAFGLLHSFNPEVEKWGFIWMMPYYIGFGILLGIITILDESLEIPLSVHAVNNIYGSLFVTFEGSALSTDALVRVQNLDVKLMLFYWIAGSALFFYILWKKYKWKFDEKFFK